MRGIIVFVSVSFVVLSLVTSGHTQAKDYNALKAEISSLQEEVSDIQTSYQAKIESVKVAILSEDSRASYRDDYEDLVELQDRLDSLGERLDALRIDLQDIKSAISDEQYTQASDLLDSAELILDTLDGQIDEIIKLGEELGRGRLQRRISGELAVSAGNTTKRESARFLSLREEFVTDTGNRYSFIQSWEGNHSVQSTNRGTLSATQLLNINEDGTLLLNEEFVKTTDVNKNSNSHDFTNLGIRWNQRFSTFGSRLDSGYAYRRDNFLNNRSRSYTENIFDARITSSFRKTFGTDLFYLYQNYDYDFQNIFSQTLQNWGGNLDIYVTPTTWYRLRHVSYDKSFSFFPEADFVQRDYEGQSYYQFSNSQLALTFKYADQGRPNLRGRSFSQQGADISIRSQLTPNADSFVGAGYLDKNFTTQDPFAFTRKSIFGTLNVYPDPRARFFLIQDYQNYDYLDPTFSFIRSQTRLGTRWDLPDLRRLSMDVNYENDNYTDNLKDYNIKGFTLEGTRYYLEGHSVRLFMNFSRFQQPFFSLNDYDSQRFGAEVGYKLTPEFTLLLSYDNTLRDYKTLPNYREEFLEGRLLFSF